MSFPARLAALASGVLLATTVQVGDLPEPAHPGMSTASSSQVTCADLVPYQTALLQALDDHPEFLDHWQSEWRDTTNTMDRDEVQAIVDDGNALLDDLEALDAPAAYAPGHEGVIAFFAYHVDAMTFYGLDTAISPDQGMYQDALILMYVGESRAAESCPDEVRDAGGFILFGADVLEDVLFP